MMNSSRPILALPQYFALKSKSNGKYLRYHPEAGAVLKFSSDEIVSPYVKFHSDAVTHLREEGGTMYHLRCCYNNKYWHITGDGSIISGGANAPVEDTADNKACTLFKAEFDGKGIVRLLHGQSNSAYLSCRQSDHCLQVAPSRELAEVCEVVDYSESVVLLPKLVAFKGDNGKYLKHISKHIFPMVFPDPFPVMLPRDTSYWTNGIQPSADRIEDPWAAHEVFINEADATIRIKSIKEGKFWKRTSYASWIICASTDTSFDDKDTVFQVVKVGGLETTSDNTKEVKIALRNCGNGLLCKRHHDGDIGTRLIADGEHKDDEACQLVVEEAVKFRRIFDVDPRSADERVFSSSITIDPELEVYPNLTSITQKVTHKTSVSETHTATFSNTTTWKVGGKVNVDFKVNETLAKYLGGVKVEVSGEFSKGGTDTTSHSKTTTDETTREYIVPPMKQVRLSKELRTTTRELPLSYTYTDQLYNDDEVVPYRAEDGLLSLTVTKEVIVPIEEPLRLPQ